MLLETERLLLRPLELSDAPMLSKLANNIEIAATTLSMPFPYPEGAAESFIRALQESAELSPDLNLGMIRKADQQWMGIIHLGVNHRHQHAEFGYWIGVPYWSQGYTSEAAQRLVDHAFADLGLRRVYASYFTHNVGSRRVMEKVGMTYEGRLRQHYERFGNFYDVGYYGIMRDEWEAQRR